MDKRLEILEVEKIDGFGMLVSFSDGTFANYTVEQLANMIPKRSKIQKWVKGQAVLGNMVETLKKRL